MVWIIEGYMGILQSHYIKVTVLLLLHVELSEGHFTVKHHMMQSYGYWCSLP